MSQNGKLGSLRQIKINPRGTLVPLTPNSSPPSKIYHFSKTNRPKPMLVLISVISTE